MNIEPNKIYTVYICGIGGQGIITLSKKIIDSLLSNPDIHDIVLSESRGVSQREGMVSSIIRFYYKPKSEGLIENSIGPFPYPGQANIFIGLEMLESLRNLKFISKNGIAIINEVIIYPKSIDSSKKLEVENLILSFGKIIKEKFPEIRIIKKNFNQEAINQYENVVFATNLIFKQLQTLFPTLFLS